MQPGLLFQFNGSLGREEQQSPEHSHPVAIQIGGSHRSPALNKPIEINPVQSIVPSVQKDTEGCRCLGQLFPVSEFSNLSNRFTVAVALASLATEEAMPPWKAELMARRKAKQAAEAGGAPPPEAAAQPPPVPMSSYLGGGDDSIERAPTAPSPDPVGPTHYDV